MTTESPLPTFVIYHASCADGFTAAWVVHRYGHLKGFGPEYELYYASYGSPPPDVTGRDVVIVDFSFRHDEMLAMQEAANSIICLDHHDAIEQEVKDLDFVIFDNSRSGAGIAWDYFQEDELDNPRKGWYADLVNYVEDRDLWTWKLPRSKEVSAALSVTKMTIENWTAVQVEMAEDFDAVVARGATILEFQTLMASQKAKQTNLRNIRGHLVPCVNLAVKLQSEVGHMLCDVEDNPPFAASFFLMQDDDGAEIAVFSLRSTDRGEDVGAIAKSFEYKGRTGGGHRNAAGFSVPLSALYEGLA